MFSASGHISVPRLAGQRGQAACGLDADCALPVAQHRRVRRANAEALRKLGRINTFGLCIFSDVISHGRYVAKCKAGCQQGKFTNL